MNNTETILKHIFSRLDDKKDIFNYIQKEDICDFICYSTYGEYGHEIQICDKNGITNCTIFISTLNDLNLPFVTTFYNNLTHKGIVENIYSNRSEIYVDDRFHSCGFNGSIHGVFHTHYYEHEINEKMRLNTRSVLYDKKYPTLHKFIIGILEKRKDDITLLPCEELSSIKNDISMSDQQLRSDLLRKIYDLEQSGIIVPNIPLIRETKSICDLIREYKLMQKIYDSKIVLNKGVEDLNTD